jgi:hypothetical protein
MTADVPVPADYDNDGMTDLAAWRPNTGEWWILRSSNGYDQNKAITFRWGKSGDVPVQADYDGDHKADFAVFRSTENRWYIRNSSNGKSSVHTFGLAGLDTLVPADYTGDKKPTSRFIAAACGMCSTVRPARLSRQSFGFNDDVAVPSDYDGDGITDLAVYRSGTWYVSDSSRPRLRTYNFGQAADVPVNSGIVRASIVASPKS